MHLKLIGKKFTLSILAASLALPGCADLQSTEKEGFFKHNFASDDPCSNNSRNIAALTGLVAGGLLGKVIGDGKTGAIIAGAAIGSLIGGFIGSDIDQKRCDLSKVAKEYDLDIQLKEVHADENTVFEEDGSKDDNDARKKSEPVGTAVSVRDKDGAGGHFEPNSDKLTAKAKQYFAAIADSYNPKKTAGTIVDSATREQYLKAAMQKKMLLVGHTDDTGSTKINADLSERRAKAVAKFMKEHGIPESMLYFQGAGESMPVADNRTELGREQNRRVEIVELSDETNFKKYLESRKPKYEYYRSHEQDGISNRSAVSSSQLSRSSEKVAAAKSTVPRKPTETATNTVERKPIATAKTAKNWPAINETPKFSQVKPIIDFGGVSANMGGASVDAGKLIQEEGGFSLIRSAQADDSVILKSCNYDRPRAAGAVKSLQTGKTYATSEFLPGLYGKTWSDTVNGNLVVLNHVSVLRDGATPANPPELKIYANYDPSKNRNPKPDVQQYPNVNTNKGSKGILYRIFAQSEKGVQCMDVLFPIAGGNSAKAGKVIYNRGSEPFAANFKPSMN